MSVEHRYLTPLRRALPYALFAFLVLVFLWKPIFTGKALLPGDYLAQMAPWSSVVKADTKNLPQWNPLEFDAIAQFYPWRVFYARSMASGHIPLWNPHQFSGTPFLANGQSACLYPFNLLFLIFNPITAFTIFAALHLFLAQVFMYWLMRELGAKVFGGIVAAIVFAFSAFMVLWLELPTFISVAVWLPLALMLTQRAVTRRSVFYGMLSGAVLGLTFLAGHFQIAFYVVLASGLWWLWKLVLVWREEGLTYSFLKVGIPLIGCVIITGLISAPQVLPTQELAANSHRVRQITEDGYQTFLDNALPTYRLVTAFASWFYGDPSHGDYYLLGRVGDSRHMGSAADYMEYGMYAGILPLMLALIALGSIKRKHVGFFVLLTALALLTATGTPINRLFYFGIPGFSALGGPNRILLLYLFGIAALAGFGADWLYERWGDRAVLRREPRGTFPSWTWWWLSKCWRDKDVVQGRRIPITASAIFGAFLLTWVCAAIASNPAYTFMRGMSDKWEPPGLAANVGLPLTFGLTFCAVMLCGLRSEIGRRVFAVLAVAVLVADLFAFGINYNPTCERSKVYPKTALTTELQKLTKNGERIAPINPKWSLFEVPKDTILPPNAAMVYGLYDVQGYDSLYLKSYKDLSCKIQGEDSCPPENGNMLVVRRYTQDVALLVSYVVTKEAIGDTRAKHIKTVDGIHIYRLPGKHLTAPEREPFSFRFGLFLMLIGVGALSCVGVCRVQRYRIRSQR